MKSRAEQIADAFEESRFSYSIEVADIRDAAIYMAEWADKNPINTHTDQAHSMLLHYQKDLSKAKETLDIALQALEFYADRGNWDDDQFCPTVWDDGSIDLGNKAKEALSKISEVLK